MSWSSTSPEQIRADIDRLWRGPWTVPDRFYVENWKIARTRRTPRQHRAEIRLRNREILRRIRLEGRLRRAMLQLWACVRALPKGKRRKR